MNLTLKYIFSLNLRSKIAVLLIFFINIVFSQVKISGIALDEKTHKSIPYVVIKTSNENVFFADFEGKFSFEETESLTFFSVDRKSTRLNSSHVSQSRMPSSA